MTEKEQEILHNNDKEIATLKESHKGITDAVETMAENLSAMSAKVSDLVDTMNAHLLLNQKVDSMDENIRESFKNRDKTREENLKEFDNRLVQAVKSCVSNTELQISNLKTELATDRETVLQDIDAKGYARLWKGLGVAFLAMTFIFGYLYLDIKAVHDTMMKDREFTSDLDKKVSTHIAVDNARRYPSEK